MEIVHALFSNSAISSSFHLRFVHHFRFAKSILAPSQIFLLGNPLNISLWSLSGPPGVCPPSLGDACWLPPTLLDYNEMTSHRRQAEPWAMANR